MTINHDINRLVDFCHGREGQQDAVGATARFIDSHKPDRPAKDRPSRWASLEDLKTHARHFGPNVTAAQLDAAHAAANAAP
jgi:hypothetical protein